ncbi:MAG: methyl-accepting chemotaxis protein, partial [Bacillota bacterium]|nr:methyl-accepting chemotaxis protein [Bacillota bacterium]
TIFTEPYIDSASKTMEVSVARAVLNDGKLAGVVSIDIDLSTLSKMFSGYKVGSTGYVNLVDLKGSMVAHPDTKQFGKDDDVTKVSGNFWNKVKANEEGFMSYDNDGSNQYASYATNKTTGWKLIATQDSRELSADTNSIRGMTILLLFIIAVLAVLISSFVSRSITKHLRKLKDIFEMAAGGDLSVKVDIKAKDEIGSLAESFNIMIEKIGTLIRNVKESADTIVNTSDVISNMSNETTRTISEIAVTIDQVAQGTSSQAQDINNGVGAIDELANEMENIAKLSDEISTVSVETSQLGSNGLKIVNVLIEKTQENNKAAATVGSSVNEMGSAISEISIITDTIDSIAGQTNLLALNAAIEAARAGEAGRGFSVVAEEIRKLAEQSTAATKQIQSLIQKISAAGMESVKSMDEAKIIVEAQNSAVSETRDIFGKIRDSIESLKNKINEVQVSVNETNKNKDNLVNAMQSISAVAEENSASTEQVSASTQEVTAAMEEFNSTSTELKELAGNLEEQLTQFKL